MSNTPKKPPAAVVAFPALKFAIEVDEDIANAFSALALALGKTPEQLLGDAINMVFDRYGKPQPGQGPKPAGSPPRRRPLPTPKP